MTDRSSRRAIAVVFVLHGLLFASWTAHIPAVKGHLDLTDGALGLALLGAPIGSVLLTAATGWLLPRYGSRAIIRVALVGYCASGPFVGLAGSLPALFFALLGWGAFQGMLDVAMNTQAIAVERHQHRRIMSGLHGGWGTGAFLGAAVGSAGVAVGLSLAWQLLLLGVAGVAIGLAPTRALLTDESVEPIGVPARQRFSALVLLLGAVCFASMFCEGAAADWAAVYLHDDLGTAASTAGLAYTTFALSMVAVRLGGNRLADRVSERRVVPALAVVATIGFGIALALDRPAAAFAGYACLGLGIGSVVPSVFSAAGRLPGLHPGSSVATVAAFGWAGFVAGPPLIGWLAGAASLRDALILLPVLTAGIALTTLRTSALRS
ncbi:MAG TPA: MFS transporter [Mycobacteriales bacterium]